MKKILSAAALAAVVCACGATGGGPHGGGGGSGGDVGHGGTTSSSSASTSGGGDGSSGGSGAGTSTASGTGGGAPPECATDADCPGAVTECRSPRCDAGNCVTDFRPAGTVVDEQSVGDCSVYECNGAGDTRRWPAPSDFTSDGNDCTTDACNGVVPTHDPAPSGTPCSGGWCSGGACVECLTDANCSGSRCIGNVCIECINGADCASGVCAGNVCQAPACDDGVLNGGEGGVDCGGPCPRCPNGTPCVDASACESAACVDGACACGVDHIVISEVKVGGANGQYDEYVELYNPTSSTLSMANAVIDTSSGRIWGPTSLALLPGGRYLIAGADIPAGIFPNARMNAGASLSVNGHVILSRMGDTPIDEFCYCREGSTCPTVPYSGSCREGPKMVNYNNYPYTDQSMSRLPAGYNCTDTDDSVADFYTSTPSTPRH